MPTLRLISRQDIAADTTAFTFEKPVDFRFTPGQFVELRLLNPPETDAEGDARAFSIASAPFEPALMVATRMRNTAFKRVLKRLPLPAEVEVDGPYGTFTLPEDGARPVVFIVGGIGITPARSIVLQAAKSRLPHRIYLFYSNRQPADAAFLPELDAAERDNPNYLLIATMTETAKSLRTWAGETGRVGWPMLAKHLPDPTGPVYYVCGPPGMVSAILAVLHGADVSSAQVRVEEFEGY